MTQSDALCIAIGTVRSSFMDNESKNEVIKLMIEILEGIEQEEVE